LCSAWCWHEIDTVGKDVSRFTEGDRVFGFDRFAFGCYAECKCTAETGVLTAKPSNLSYEQAAAIPYGRLTHKSALIRYKDWIWRCTEQDSPWGGGGEPVPAAPVRAPAERFLADAILVSGDYRQHGLPEGALLSVRPVAGTEVHLLLHGSCSSRSTSGRPSKLARERSSIRPCAPLQQRARHRASQDALSRPTVYRTLQRETGSPPHAQPASKTYSAVRGSSGSSRPVSDAVEAAHSTLVTGAVTGLRSHLAFPLARGEVS